MRSRTVLIAAFAAAFCLVPAQHALAWRGGFGGFHAGYGGFSSFHAGGFGDGFGSVHYGGWSHVGPVTGFTHVSAAGGWGAAGYGAHASATHVGWGGAEHYGGWGGYHTDSGAWGGYHTAYTYHGANYGSITHYDTAYHVPGTYGAWGHAAVTPAGYGAAVVHGPMGGTAAVYHGPFTSGAVATLPAGFTATAWHGATYYHYGYSFYHPVWFAGTVSYVPILPPAGFFFAALPVGATQTVINNNTYYVSNGAYYQPTTQNGQAGYTVVEAPVSSTPPAAVPAAGVPGPDPMQLLKKMSDYLGREKHVVMTISETFDEVAIAGQKIQLTSERTVRLERPDKIEVEVTGPSAQRTVVYNGSMFTVIDRSRNIYASIPMQGTLDTVMDTLSQQYGMAQPVDDLLYSDIDARLAGKITSALYLGEDKIEGKKCQHLAFQQPGVAWQIWIEKGDKPVPRKVVITYQNTPGRPQYMLLITKWETPLIMPGGEFKAKIPPDATSASMMTLTGQTAPS